MTLWANVTERRQIEINVMLKEFRLQRRRSTLLTMTISLRCDVIRVMQKHFKPNSKCRESL